MREDKLNPEDVEGIPTDEVFVAPEEDKKYEVVRFREGKTPVVLRRNLTKEEAKTMVNQPNTSGGKEGRRWFWGFREQG